MAPNTSLPIIKGIVSSERAADQLDEEGIICLGAKVKSGSILVQIFKHTRELYGNCPLIDNHNIIFPLDDR